MMHATSLARLKKRSHSAPARKEEDILSPKRGRPTTSSVSPASSPAASSSRSSRLLFKIKHKEKKCMFHKLKGCVQNPNYRHDDSDVEDDNDENDHDNKCKKGDGVELHKVVTNDRGQKLLDIKKDTHLDDVRVACANLFAPSDAKALELYYHRNCFRAAERSCEEKIRDQRNEIRFISDCEIVLYVTESLTEASHLTMNQINDTYVTSLLANGYSTDRDSNFKKYLKDLLMKNVPDIQIVRPKIQKLSDIVTLKKTVSESLSTFLENQSALPSMIAVLKAVRNESLQMRKWKFEGDFTTWQGPLLMKYILKYALVGHHSNKLHGLRDAEIEQTIDTINQVICQNVKTDRQIFLQSDLPFKQTVETPVSIGIPLSIHTRFRDYQLVQNLSDIYIGSEYRHLIDLEKRVEYAVLDRASQTSWYCIPDFIKKGVHLWFAVDNIDFQEFTAYGQNSLHGTVLVVFQRDEDGELINPPIKIPIKLPSQPLKMKVQYKPVPEIEDVPIKFPHYSHGFGEGEAGLKKYNVFTRTWALSSFAGNETFTEIPENLSSVVPADASTSNDTQKDDVVENTPNVAADVCIMETDEHDNYERAHIETIPQNSVEEREQHLNPEESMELDEPKQDGCEEVAACSESAPKVISFVKESKKKEPYKKDAVMPTWSAAQHLIEKHKRSEIPVKTNSEVVTPILRRPPKDWPTLLTVLSMAQEISAVVVGPNRRVVITLDMDLYRSALKLRASVKNKHWLLQPGKLHKFFADEHALGKTTEGSGIDHIAVECGIYSAATMRAILAGKKYTQGVEYHLTMGLAMISLKLEEALGSEVPDALAAQAKAFKEALHKDSDDLVAIYDDLANQYDNDIEHRIKTNSKGLPKFLDNYLEQIEVMLTCISAIHSRDLDACLTAMDRGVKYYGAHDLPNYFQLIPIYLAEMCDVRKNDQETWEYLKRDFVVTKSTEAFCNLFVDQGLEQEIKKLKRYGALPGITQDDDAFNRFTTTAPHLVRIVEKFLSTYPKTKLSSDETYHQLQGNMGLRCALNAVTIKNCLVTYCEGNPYMNNTPLKNVVSSALIPEPAATDILTYPEKGQARYEWLVENRILEGSPESIWDPLPQLKLKRFANYMPRSTIKVGGKTYKGRQDRGFMKRCLVTAKSRPELLEKLPGLIGNYELSLYPYSFFSNDGKLLISKDKASLMKLILEKQPQRPIRAADIASKKKVLITDAMVEVRALKKFPDTTKMIHLKQLFLQRVKPKMDKYSENRLLFDIYKELGDFSFKEGAREQRAQDALGRSAAGDYEIHDQMSLKKTPLKELFNSIPTKRRLTKYLAEAVLEEYEGDLHHVVIVSYGTTIAINKPHSLDESFRSHTHEEADTQIPLHILHSIKMHQVEGVTNLHFDVLSIDTDVLILLIDLASHGPIDPSVSIYLRFDMTARRKKAVDIRERVECLGEAKSQGLLGFHEFTGSDWGGKSGGVTKERYTKIYLELPDDAAILRSFALLGSYPSDRFILNDGDIHTDMKPFEKFSCLPWTSDGPYTVPECRWKLYSTKNSEHENLPPTRAALLPQLQRINHVCFIERSYDTPHPNPPPVTENGWKRDEDVILPVYCLMPPAPKDIIELVDCGCKTGCTESRFCKCLRNNQPCTSFCKCGDNCLNTVDSE